MTHLLSWREINGSHRLMALFVLSLGLVNFFSGDKIPAGGGLGYDGTTYGYMVKHLDSILLNGELSPYYMHRILVPAIVHGMLKLAGATLTDFNIIRAFEVYNLSLLMVATWMWKRISDRSSLSLPGRWIGFAGLFLSFMGSKMVFYYPVLTDTTGLFLGLLSLAFYLEKRPIALFITALIGSFAWPLVGICGAILLIMPWSKPPLELIAPQPSRPSTKHTWAPRLLLLGWFSVLVASIVGFLMIKRAQSTLGIADVLGIPAVTWQLGLTSLPSLTGTLIALVMLAGPVLYLRSVMGDIRNVRLLNWVLAVLVLLIPWMIFREIQNHYIPNTHIRNPDPLNPIRLFNELVLPPLPGKFLLPLVSLTVYWGPLVLCLLLTWKTFCREARALGFGFVAVVAFTLVFGLAGEPRYPSFAWPFFVLGAALALERTEKTPRFKYVFVVLVVLFGQFWMKLNLWPWTGNDYELLDEYPKHFYFMHLGFWMNWWSYSLQLLAVVLSTWWLRKNLRTAPAMATRQDPPIEMR